MKNNIKRSLNLNYKYFLTIPLTMWGPLVGLSTSCHFSYYVCLGYNFLIFDILFFNIS